MKVGRLKRFILNNILYWVSKMITKDDNIWVFGAWFGDKYADNSKYLYEYVNQYQTEIRAIWVTDNDEIIKDLELIGYEVYKKYSLKAIRIGLKAKYSIFVHSNATDCMSFLNSGAKLIQLWHGIPLKKIGNDDSIKFRNISSSTFNHIFFPFMKEYNYLCISTSEEDKSKFISAFVSKKVVVTGYPRNDIFFNSNIHNINELTITYLPTFRDDIGDEIDLFTDFGFNIGKWNLTLKKLGINFNIKMHPVNKPKDSLLESFSHYENIKFLNEIDVSEILPNTDVLITDYSSVFFDYLLTNRPIIFAPFDYEKYITKDREFYYDYNEVTPGPKCKDWDEVLSWIIKFNENKELYKNEREIIKNRFHVFRDGSSCERVYNEIITLSKSI